MSARIEEDGMRPRSLFFLMVAILMGSGALAGCQSSPTPRPFSEDPLSRAPAIKRGLDAQGLAALLEAEFAGHRGDFTRAARGYLSQGERYHSSALASRATLAAQLARDDELLTRSALLWSHLQPDAQEPRQLLAERAAANGDWQQALTQLLAIDARGGDAELEAFVQEAADAGADISAMLERLQAHAVNHPNQPAASIAAALLYARQGEFDTADTTLDGVAQRFSNTPSLWLARSQVAMARQHFQDGLKAAQHGHRLAPGDARFLLAMAQAYLALGRSEQAEQQFDHLLNRMPDNSNLRLSLARLYLQHHAEAQAERVLAPLLEQEKPVPEALLLAALTAERRGQTDQAVYFYEQVPPGEHFPGARARAAHLLVEHQRLEEAIHMLDQDRNRYPEQNAELLELELSLLDSSGQSQRADRILDHAIAQSAPDNDALLFMRAIRSLNSQDLSAMEQDMKTLLERDPDDAIVLNAYGYTLLEHTHRYREALDMIQHAHRLAPDNPAILDSLGWAWFKLGQFDKASHWLNLAWQAQPDAEIGAHFVEALWRNQQHDQARQLVSEMLERLDHHPELDRLLERYPGLESTTHPSTSETENPSS
ncbi:tetratricopeptide repeat protein [Kushneria phosphatilytica]|nr:tetratricopeptide repeat protein [Kushneria phosphatilytica]